ncbi:hypothetical protein PL1_2709 [Paenibacillus larvae subsp. larvae B-3650]|nr:hypothetical protein PL1_2709 [Paenibacillus larvae subsp. larvae B-3650]
MLAERKETYEQFKDDKKALARQTYTTNVVSGNIMLLDGFIKLPKLKLVKMKQHREIPSHHIIKSCTVSRTKTGKYYVSILTENEHQPIQKQIQAVVGLDFSMNGLFVDSEEGKTANYPRFYQQALEKLAKKQRILSRRKKGSNRWHKQGLEVAKLHERIANQRKDFLHKESQN